MILLPSWGRNSACEYHGISEASCSVIERHMIVCILREGCSCDLTVYEKPDFPEWAISKARPGRQVIDKLVRSVEILYAFQHS